MLLGAGPCVGAVAGADGGDDNAPLTDDNSSSTRRVTARVAVGGQVGQMFLVRDNVAGVPWLVDLVHDGTSRMLQGYGPTQRPLQS